MADNEFDYIVIGSGSAGGAVLGRLSENGRFKVLCLEAGTKGAKYIWTRPPAGAANLVDNPAANWRYQSESHEGHGNRQIYVPRGKILGGSSAINGTIYNRGQKADYDTWGQMGCRGWSFEDVLPFLKKIESTDIGDDAHRGRSGPIRVTEAAKLTPFYDLFIDAAKAQGLPHNPDYSGETQEGVAMAQQTVFKGERESTAVKYIEPARKRSNVTVHSGAEAEELLFEGKRCIGVSYRRNGRVEKAFAAREIIVSCGTANTPKLLELSGIGNPKILSEHGIKTFHELQGVGENLRDHFGPILKWRFNQEGLSLAKRGQGARFALEIAKYVTLRKGFISQGIGTLRVFARSRPELENPDVMMVVAPYMIEMRGGRSRRMSPIEGFFMYSHAQRTESTGTMHIGSADPSAPPKIGFRFLQTTNDRLLAIASIRMARAIVESPPLAEKIAEELAPGANVQSDDEILEYVRNEGTITHHMIGTCKMGHDPMAVVDDRLRIHGLEGIRVADASIMPTLTSGNTNIPSIMIGEKCAAMVLEDAA